MAFGNYSWWNYSQVKSPYNCYSLVRNKALTGSGGIFRPWFKCRWLCFTVFRERGPSSEGGPNKSYDYGQSPYWHYGFRRVWLKHNVNFKGWNSQDCRGFPGKFESSNLSRDNLSREIGRSPCKDDCGSLFQRWSLYSTKTVVLSIKLSGYLCSSSVSMSKAAPVSATHRRVV